MKIAVASSGLGHVARGIESWARDTAAALAERGADVTLFCGAPLGAAGGAPTVTLPCLRRGRLAARWLARVTPGGAWRWGLKSPYGWEQFSFWWRLWPALRRGRFELLHVQDPMLAYWCRRCRHRGWLPTREILAHGTEEALAFLKPFAFVQHLAPWHLEQARHALQQQSGKGAAYPQWVAIPNFVDTGVFGADREAGRAFRAQQGIPADARVIGCAAAVKKHHKRIDYLIREFVAARGTPPPESAAEDGHLLLAGARTAESQELVALAERCAPGRIHFCLDLPRAAMPDFYRALDLFVLPSLFEMMPIAVLEALASGVPVVANRHPVLQWMIEDAAEGCPSGGACLDLAPDGALAGFLGDPTPAWLAQHGRQARTRAERMFAKEVVIGRYLDYYRAVAAAPEALP